jgi:hypothetical protein
MARVAMALQASQPSGLWPFPGLYLIEVVALASVVFVAVLVERPRAFAVAWIAVGAMSALAILGALTIGPFIGIALVLLVPATLLADAGLTSGLRRVVAFLLGLVLQAGGMFAVIQAMLRR